MFAAKWDNPKHAAFNCLLDFWRVFAELKEVVFFLYFFILAVMVGANAVVGFDDCFREKCFVAGAIPAGVFAFVDIFF